MKLTSYTCSTTASKIHRPVLLYTSLQFAYFWLFWCYAFTDSIFTSILIINQNYRLCQLLTYRKNSMPTSVDVSVCKACSQVQKSFRYGNLVLKADRKNFFKNLQHFGTHQPQHRTQFLHIYIQCTLFSGLLSTK